MTLQTNSFKLLNRPITSIVVRASEGGSTLKKIIKSQIQFEPIKNDVLNGLQKVLECNYWGNVIIFFFYIFFFTNFFFSFLEVGEVGVGGAEGFGMQLCRGGGGH